MTVESSPLKQLGGSLASIPGAADRPGPEIPENLVDFFKEIRDYLQFSDADRDRIHAALPHVESDFDDLIADFYNEIKRHEGTRRVLVGGAVQIERLKRTLRHWLVELFTSDYDSEYARARWRVGCRHVEVGLDQTYATAALGRLRSGLNRSLTDNWPGSSRELVATAAALNRLLDLEATIINASYQWYTVSHLQAQAEVEIQQQERLAAIGQMITGLTHESRNLLQRSHACLAALTLDIEGMPDALQQADRIQAALDHLQLLYEEVRNYAAPIKLDLAQVQMRSLIEAAWQALEPYWKPQQLDLQIEFQPGAPQQVILDLYRMDQVFHNVLRNAIEASPAGSTVHCSIQSDDKNNQLLVQIRDCGPGIDEKSRQRIFEPFFTTKRKGTGLGLPISRRIMNAHGGTITVDSLSANGAVFTLSLPLKAHLTV